MADPSDALFELIRRYAEDEFHISDADISRWTGGLVEHEEFFYDSLAALLARGYHERQYSFEFCDAVVNNLYGLMIGTQLQTPPPAWPNLFWRVFEAFDAGEFHRKPDKSDDPIAGFTDPEIANIVLGF
jgi:hypothetical protein